MGWANNPLSSTALKKTLIDGSEIRLCDVTDLAAQTSANVALAPIAAERMRASVALIDRAVEQNERIYGVTTGFGGMAGVVVSEEHAEALQSNLLSFLASGAGDEIDRRHTRAAMLLRANVLAQGCSGIRPEIVDRILRFLSADATPVVRELGSIGASGDLVPLSVIGRAVTGVNDSVNVRLGDRLLAGSEALAELGLEPISLRPKEGLALVNGTSFSAAVAANAVSEARCMLSLTFAVQAMMLQALQAQEDPLDEFVHQKKPHPGQLWSARTMRQLLQEGRVHTNPKPSLVQDRYSLRCLPQYLGSVVEGIARITHTVETEMNSVSDNPLVDLGEGRICQSGNFLGQYVGLAMDDLRRFTGLMAKHLDVQIATLVAPEFNSGLPASLRGNSDVPYNMGLKGLQITGNSIMPMLTWYGNPLVEHFPTHAEQFNQNVNGLSWGSAHLAWKSTGLFRHYLAVALMFGVQALDLRAKSLLGHYDGRAIIGSMLTPLYEAACRAIHVEMTGNRPLLFNDSDLWIEQHLSQLNDNMQQHGSVMASVEPILKSFADEFDR